jgi:photosystem II stability/assembly factor-like uncharacterized protein
MIPTTGRRFLVSLSLLALAAPLAAVPGSWRVLGPDGGSVYDLAVAPSQPQTLYAAASSGLFRSVNGGAYWVYAGAGPNRRGANSLAVDPLHPRTVYAAQDGIYKSLDGGATWTKKAAFQANKVIISVRGSGAVYAIAPQRIYKSTNGGGTWTPLTRGLPLPSRPLQLVVDPVDPNRLYAVLMGLNSHVYGVFKSADGGLSWKHADQGLPANQAIGALAIDPGTPKILYAGTNDNRVFKSRDGGALWHPTEAPVPQPISALWIDPAHGNVVFAATVIGLFRSENGGGTWMDISRSLPAGAVVRVLTFLPGSPRRILAAVLTYARAERGGVLASLDEGSSWTLRSKGLSALDVTSVAVAPGALWAIGNEILFKSTDRGETWKRIRFEPVGLTLLIAVDPAAPENVYAELFDYSLWRSRDGGESWEMIGKPQRQISRLVFGPGSSSTLYAAGNGLSKSTDGGTTWAPLLNAVVYDLEISPSSPSTLYAAVQAYDSAPPYQVLRSTDGGGTWVSTPTVANGLLTTLAVDPQAPETLYTTFGSRIYRSTDGGATWSPFGDDVRFQDRTLYPLLFEAPATLHVGVWLDDVYRLADGTDTNSWEPLGDSPGLLTFNVLAADPQSPCRIYAGTNERGLLAFTESGTAACP